MGARRSLSANANASTGQHGAQVHDSGNANGAGAIDGNGSASGAAAGEKLRLAAFNGNAVGSDHVEAHPTEIPSVILASDATGSASGMLSASRRNVHLDSGTQMMLGISSTLVQ